MDQLINPPGPKLPRFLQSMFWLLRPLDVVEFCRRRYGDVFTLHLLMENDLVVIGRPDLINAAVGTTEPDLRTGEGNGKVLEPLLGINSVLLLDGKEHLRQRKLLLPAFHGERMRQWSDVIAEVTRDEVATWPRGVEFALRPAMQRLTLDVILRVVFGMSEGVQMDQIRKQLGVLAHMSKRPLGIVLTYNRNLGPWTPYARFLRVRNRMDRVIYDVIAERRRAGDAGERTDVLSTLVLARDENGTAMTDVEIRDELVTLLFAGHETTATSLAWCFDLLTHSSQAMGKLESEINSGDGDTTEYLNAVIDETLRLRPPVFIVARHAKRPVHMDGTWRIPADTTLAPCIHLLHRNPDIHPEPETFRPERFLGRRPEPREWIPFGGGIRRCLGASFANLEMRIAIPEIMRTVNIEAVDPEMERYRREAVTIVPRHGTRVVVHDRPAVHTAVAKASSKQAQPV